MLEVPNHANHFTGALYHSYLTACHICPTPRPWSRMRNWAPCHDPTWIVVLCTLVLNSTPHFSYYRYQDKLFNKCTIGKYIVRIIWRIKVAYFKFKDLCFMADVSNTFVVIRASFYLYFCRAIGYHWRFCTKRDYNVAKFYDASIYPKTCVQCVLSKLRLKNSELISQIIN